MSDEIRVSLVATVLNEAASIESWLQSILRQTRLPDEIVIVDGGSHDATCQIITGYQNQLPINLIVEQDINIAAGRNIAVAAAHNPIIACTDAGTRLDKNWLAALIKPFAQNPEIMVVGGVFIPDYCPTRPFEVAMSAAVLPMPQELNATTFLPSSRSVAFRKTAWEAVGGYPEWLDYSEDLIFDIRLKTRFRNFALAPEAIVYFKPRTTMRSYIRQYFHYATGDGHANLWFKRHLVRYTTYFILLPVIFVLGLVLHPIWWGLAVIGALVYLYPMYRRLPYYWQELSGRQKVSAIIGVMLIRVIGDIAKMVGYPAGWWKHLQYTRPNWRKL
jgi:glycosyltransferase involved in cell wall biosynthesis